MEHEPLEEYKLDLKTIKPEFPKPFKKICCPSCNGDVPADNLNINDKIAKCNNCNVVFPFQEDIANFDTTPRKVKQEILRPEGIELFYYKDELDISFAQPTMWVDVILAIFSPFFVMASFGTSIAFFTKGIPILVPLLFLIPTIFMIWYFIQQYQQKHKIHLTIDDRNLHIQWRPKNLHKDKSYRIQDINQIYVKKRKDMDLHGIYMITNSGAGQKHVMLTSVRTISKAKFLEQEIERHLGIQDREVPEEDK